MIVKCNVLKKLEHPCKEEKAEDDHKFRKTDGGVVGAGRGDRLPCR